MKNKWMFLLFFFVLSLIFTLHSDIYAEESVQLSNPTYDVEADYAVWDCIYFGCFPQFDLNVKEPVKWRVLSVNDNEALLITDMCLLSSAYMNIKSFTPSWRLSAIKSNLRMFANEAFNEEESDALISESYYIKDIDLNNIEEVNDEKIRILSWDEACNPDYGFCPELNIISNTRRAEVTLYAFNKTNGTVHRKWWLNSRGGAAKVKLMYITENGYLDTNGVLIVNEVPEKFEYYSIRPVIKIDLTKTDAWVYAGTVDSKLKSVLPDDFVMPEVRPTKVPATTPTPVPPQIPEAVDTPVPTEIVQYIPTPSPTAELHVTQKPDVSTKPIVINLQKSKIKSLKKQGRNLKVKVKKVKSADGYQIAISTKKNGKFKVKLTIKSPDTSGVINKLNRKKTYYVKVRAFSVTSEKKVYSKYSNAKKIKL